MLEVLRFDPDTSTAVVMAGFGRRSDWYQNLQRHPALEVVVGRQAFRPVHRQLTQNEAVSVMARYERRNRLGERPLVALWPDTTPATSDHAPSAKEEAAMHSRTKHKGKLTVVTGPAVTRTEVVERAPRAELRHYPASHFEMYHGEVFRQVRTDQVEFLRSHLLPAATGRR